jgi:hypothetical protein
MKGEEGAEPIPAGEVGISGGVEAVEQPGFTCNHGKAVAHFVVT